MNKMLSFASVDDAKELVAIYAPYVTDTTITFEYDIPSINEFAGRIETISKKYPYLVYRIDGQIAGYAYANTFRSRMAFQWDVETSVYVKEEFHHTNVAKELYNALLALLKAQGFYKVYAYISVPNHKSTRFHEKYGFREIAYYENTGFKLDRWCNLSCMCKNLIPITTDTIPAPYKTIHELEPALIERILSAGSTKKIRGV